MSENVLQIPYIIIIMIFIIITIIIIIIIIIIFILLPYITEDVRRDLSDG